ncbi:MAG TPA: phosphotransferase [Caulobacteraceae bacterium]|nr:phosphotransferase [Caulobacteraceae bacterium]
MSAAPMALSPLERARAEAVLGWRPSAWRAVHGGYTPAARYVVSDGARRAFVKVATNPTTADMLRREARAYGAAQGPFMPQFIGWSDDAAAPLLAIEDLSEAVWPPPWTTAQIDQVLTQLAAMHGQRVDLPVLTQFNPRALDGWSSVARDARPFLSLALASRGWLDAALPALVRAEAACSVEGEALTHYDLRSDNICIAAGGAKFIDWAAAARGNPALDLGFWLPSLELEGGPAPEAMLPGRPEVAAAVSGYFAARAGLPIIPAAPRVRDIQRAQLQTALPWAIRALDLPPTG